MFQSKFSVHSVCDGLTTSKSETNVVVFDFFRVLLSFQLQERNKQHGLSTFADSKTCVNDFGLEDVFRVVFLAGQTGQNNDNITHKLIVFECILNDVEQHQLVFSPIK